MPLWSPHGFQGYPYEAGLSRIAGIVRCLVKGGTTGPSRAWQSFGSAPCLPSATVRAATAEGRAAAMATASMEGVCRLYPQLQLQRCPMLQRWTRALQRCSPVGGYSSVAAEVGVLKRRCVQQLSLEMHEHLSEAAAYDGATLLAHLGFPTQRAAASGAAV